MKLGSVLGSVGLAGGMSVVAASTASAHTGAGAFAGFAAGLAHPLAGVDHVLAMVAIGLWSAQLRGRAVVLVPAAFAALMLLGGVLGILGSAVPFGEHGVALSVLVSGVLVAAFVRAPLVLAMTIAGAFALGHGHLHGSEIPAAAAGASWIAGFLTATVTLLAAGVLAAAGLRERAPLGHVPALGTIGAGIATVGAFLLVRAGLFT